MKIERLHTYTLFILFLTFCLSDIVLSQNIHSPVLFERYSSENLKVEKGLSQNWIKCILQDKYGFMWFGTWDGLNKFDGYTFTSYNLTDGLTDHDILSLVEDTHGNLWIGTPRGLNKLDRTIQKFIQYPFIPGDTINSFKNRVNSIIISKTGQLWLGTSAGLSVFDPETETFQSLQSEHHEQSGLINQNIHCLYEDIKGNILAGTDKGIIVLKPTGSGPTTDYSVAEAWPAFSNIQATSIIQTQNGDYWIGTSKGVIIYSRKKQVSRKYLQYNDKSIVTDLINVIYEDKSGRIWIGTNNDGLTFIDEKEGRGNTYKNELGNEQSLSNNSVHSIFEDRAGNIWVGTYKGVNKIKKYSNDFGLIQQTALSATGLGLNNNFIWSFARDSEKNLFIGTSNGVNIRDARSGKFSYITHVPGNQKTLAGNVVKAILYTPDLNSMWFGLEANGLTRYDLATGEMTHFFPDDPNSLSSAYTWDLLRDHQGYIWIATGYGLNRFDPKTGTFEHYFHDPGDPATISDNGIVSLFQDREKNIWIGTFNGLNRFLYDENRFERYFHATTNDLDSYTFFITYQDSKDRMWAGTSGGGLISFEPETAKYKVYTTEDGLPNNIIYCILEDGKGDLWLTCNWGLVRMDVGSEKFVSYGVGDGLQSYEFNLGAGYKDQDGRMYFGGMNGLNIFHPKDIVINPNPPVIVVSAFRKFNEILRNELFDGDTIRLRHNESFFSFEISALDFTSPDKNQYMYYLEGVDPEWILTGAYGRVAGYKQIRPGSYRFFANGSNNDGIWSPTGLQIMVIIHPPWHATWMFRIGLAVLLIVITWYLLQRRIKKIKQKNEIERKMLDIEKQKFDLEQKALRLQMNPHFIFNSLNSIQSYIISHNQETAINYLGKFSQLMRLILTNSGKIFVPFDDEIKTITHYLDLQKLRFEEKFDYRIDVDPAIDREFTEIPPMIVQPYIENAIIHGLLHKRDKGHIQIEFDLKGDKIHCMVSDNGVGRKKSAEIIQKKGLQHQSSGMHITQARLEMLNQDSREAYNVKVTDLEDEDGNALGTEVELLIQYVEN